ncbi:MAG: orotidine-5'-phosphate decarboxylase [Promethearchaeota archaeon]|nr:MAG: orotidine-5'-phosphate decarboxylase [Candidatus Lokiarchaeota archaeon]
MEIMPFIEKLIQLIKERNSVVCMGLDPRMDGPGQIPEFLINEFRDPNKIILEFNKSLIEEVSELIPVIKPQIAFYEKYEALNALKDTIKFAHKRDMLVILDAKRNDIGSTSEAYAHSMFNIFNADACTLNAYFGFDGVKPFLEFKDKGLFILVKTSNPSSKEFQDLFSVEISDVPAAKSEIEMDSIKLERNYMQMAKLINKWGKNLPTFSNFHQLGAVVGATYPDELKSVREILNKSFILIPGYGAQGAQAKAIKFGFNKKGLGAIVNSSRGIMFAYDKMKDFPPEKFSRAAKQEILTMNKELNKIREIL